MFNNIYGISVKTLVVTNTEIKPKQGGTVPILKPYSLTPEPKDSKLTEKIQDDEKVEVDLILKDDFKLTIALFVYKN